MGLESFKQFKYEWMKEQTWYQKKECVTPLYGYKLESEEQLKHIPGKMMMTTEKMLTNMMEQISLKEYERAVMAITKANIIDIYSVENSGSAANDLTTKLLYLGLNCRMYQDYYLQRICANNLTTQDIAIGISYSGCSKDMVDVMKVAKKSGAKTIIITNFEDTTISKYAEIILSTSNEQFLYGDAIFSRVSQLVIIDMLYMGILYSDYKKYTTILDRNSKVIKDKAYKK